MVLPDINFHQIRAQDGSRHKGFEELCCQIAALESDPTQSTFFRKGEGSDAGVECFKRFSNGCERGWQAKYVFKWDNSLESQLNDSIKTALAKHPKLTEYIVCLPFDLPDARSSKARSAQQKWELWKQKWQAAAKKAKRPLAISLWSKSHISQLLAQQHPAFAGRILYWFGIEWLTPDWFDAQLAKARAALGSRYTPETNVDLPIRQTFRAITRDTSLQRQLDSWVFSLRIAGGKCTESLSEVSPSRRSSCPKGLDEKIEALWKGIAAEIVTPDKPYPLKKWIDRAVECQQALQEALEWLYGLPRQNKPKSFYSDPIQSAESSVFELMNVVDEVHSAFSASSWQLANKNSILLEGPAGIGKSHLLADVVAHQVYGGQPGLMILGSSLIDDEPWRQIMVQLDLPTGQNVSHFLGSVDAAAEAANVRAIICVDAINERHGIDIWPHRVAAFLKTVEPFQRICVVLSCRTTFIEYVLPSEIRHSIARLRHPGFASQGGSVAKEYLRKRGIVRPTVPNFLQEFNNPLFLKSCCDALEKEGLHEIPKGLHGITAVFDFYYDAIVNALNRRMNLAPPYEVVQKAIRAFTDRLIAARSTYIEQQEAIVCFEEILESRGAVDRSLLVQLESEGLLSVELMPIKGGGARHYVRFTFERMSDHAIAKSLLDDHLRDGGDIKQISPETAIYKFAVGQSSSQFQGVLEALAVQIPERTGREILELCPERHRIRYAFDESLLLRDQHAFTDRTLQFVSKGRPEEFVSVLVAIATEPTNRYGARYLDEYLRKMSMPERDLRWSVVVSHLGDDDSTVNALVTWVFDDGFGPIDPERAELAGIALSWLLATTNRLVRDRATKALAVLFASRLKLASSLLERFSTVNDPYVIERLVTAAYGAAMQNRARIELQDLAKSTYETFFRAVTPPLNALTRDSAYGILAFANAQGALPDSIKCRDFQPPYSSKWPLELVTDEMIEVFKTDYGNGNIFGDRIVASCVNDGDFARYVIDPIVRRWAAPAASGKRRPSHKDIYESWTEEFLHFASEQQLAIFEGMVRDLAEYSGKSRSTPHHEREGKFTEIESEFRHSLSAQQWEDYRVRARNVVVYPDSITLDEDKVARFNNGWARRWVCQRAHELGWTNELFEAFDREITHDRHTHTIERVGKKYQWISLYELIARMEDHLPLLGDEFGDEAEQSGSARDAGLRQIDPSMLRWETGDDGWRHFDKTWWVPAQPQLKETNPFERLAWLGSQDGIVNGSELIDIKQPETGKEWLALNSFASWRGHGVNRAAKELQKDAWFRLNCIVVKRQDQKLAIENLRNQILVDPNVIPKVELYGSWYLGELSWHPDAEMFGDWIEPDKWSKLKVPVRTPTVQYSCEMSSYDQSVKRSSHITLPAPWMARALGMNFTNGRDLRFETSSGEVIFFDPSSNQEGTTAGLVNKAAFLAMLEEADLSAIWLVAGEKAVYGGANHGYGFGGSVDHTGVYWLRDGTWQNAIFSEKRNPTEEQLQEFFGVARSVQVNSSSVAPSKERTFAESVRKSPEKGSKKGAKKGSKKPVMKSTKKAAKKGYKKPAKKSTKKAAKKSSKKPVMKSSKKAAKKGSKKPVMKSAKKAAKKGSKKPAKKSAKKAAK